MDLEKLLNLAEKHARFVIFKRKEQLPPSWLLFNGTEVHKLSTPWKNEFERGVAKMFIRKLIEKEKIVAYGFVSEVWMASVNKEEYEKEQPKIQPRHRPDREEMVLAFTTDGKTNRGRVWRIVRNWHEQVTRLELREDRNPFDHFGGWMATLLGTPISS